MVKFHDMSFENTLPINGLRFMLNNTSDEAKFRQFSFPKTLRLRSKPLLV